MDTFMFAALRVACAQLVRSAGFDNASRNAINTLTDVVANCLFIPSLDIVFSFSLHHVLWCVDLDVDGYCAMVPLLHSSIFILLYSYYSITPL